MTASLTERIDSRVWSTGESASVTLHYVLEGDSNLHDDITAYNLVADSTALSYVGLVRQSIEMEPDCIDTARTWGRWNVTIKYGQRQSPSETGDPSFSFDTGGGTQHITQSISTTQKYAPAGKTAPDFGGAIGVTHDNVEGVDITIPVYTWSETHYIDDTSVNKSAYYSLTGKVNNASFKGCAAGEVLFLGASGSKRGSDKWEITFKFAASPNRSGITVGSITGIAKKGWEYMWVRYADAEDAAAKAVVKKPVAVYIEKVYDEGNMALLGIGT
ncbi:MAG: hypothetical protein ACE15C_16410 [Phycisphaerae bacterium]